MNVAAFLSPSQQARTRLATIQQVGDVAVHEPLPPALVATFERYATALDAIDAEPYTEDAKRAKRTVIEKTVRDELTAAAAVAVAAAGQAFDQAEGEARAAAKDAIPGVSVGATSQEVGAQLIGQLHRQRTTARTAIEIEFTRQLRDPNELEVAFENAFLTEDPFAIRHIGQIVVTKLEALATAARREDVQNPHTASPVAADDIRPLLGRLQARLAAWQQAHPTPYERLRATQRARAGKVAGLERSIDQAVAYILDGRLPGQ